MQFAGAVVVLAAAFPHAEVRRPVRSLDVEHEVLYEVHLVRREDYLHRQRFTYSVLGTYRIALLKSCRNRIVQDIKLTILQETGPDK